MKKETNNLLTNDVSQMEVALVAVRALGGDDKSIDTEDVAIKCYELAPEMFSWRKYPEHINLEIVRVTLSDAKKAKYGELLVGSGRKGWRLSIEGIRWAVSRGDALLRNHAQWTMSQGSSGSIDTVRRQREKTRLLATQAWKSWRDGSTLKSPEIEQLFRMDAYASMQMREAKISRLQALLENDKDVGQFVYDAAAVARSRGK